MHVGAYGTASHIVKKTPLPNLLNKTFESTVRTLCRVQKRKYASCLNTDDELTAHKSFKRVDLHVDSI